MATIETLEKYLKYVQNFHIAKIKPYFKKCQNNGKKERCFTSPSNMTLLKTVILFIVIIIIFINNIIDAELFSFSLSMFYLLLFRLCFL